jgi:membrane-bound lytic murein transglycosylase D
MYDATMQLIQSISKFVIFTVLSCSLLLVWNFDNTEVKSIAATTTYPSEVAYVKPPESIWTSMSREFKLDHHTESAQVRAEIRKLLAERDKLYSILNAASPYIYFIHHQTQVKGLPAELALIPVIESEFNPNDHSNKGATGLWQLMPQTAHELGVKVRSGYDGRRNVIASTKAALAYFKDLGHLFNGNWLLAIAAYNCGQVTVAHATRRAGTHNFWSLHLPQETKYYVPKLLAVAAIIENPKKYGVKLPLVVDKPYFKEVKIKKAVNLMQFAKTSGASLLALNKLNPDYKLTIQPHKGGDTFLVPIDKAVTVGSVVIKA